MDIRYLTETFDRESRGLDNLLRHHPLLQPLFKRADHGVSIDGRGMPPAGSAAEWRRGSIDGRGMPPAGSAAEWRRGSIDQLRGAYLQLLKLKADYVQYTVPALRAAGEALRAGDDEDRRWSAVFLDYAQGETDETDPAAACGHQVWARNDMIALGAPAELLAAPTDPTAVLYGRYFVEDAARHPYAVLGAKGVLERFSLRVSDDLVRGLVDSGIANAAQATQFFQHHGVLDIEHVRQGDRNLAQLVASDKRTQILEAVYVTTGHYRAMVHHMLPI